MSGLLYELEEQRDRTIAQYMQDRLQEALDAYRPMCTECDLAMSKHQSYRRFHHHQGWRTEAIGSEVSMLRVWTDDQRYGTSGRREAESVLKKPARKR